MKNNYLFHSRTTAGKFILGMLFSQVIGILIFLLVALVLHSLQFDYSIIIMATILVIIAWSFLSAYFLHKEDFSLLKYGIWPFETEQDAIRQSRKVMRMLDRSEKKLIRQIDKSSGQLVKIVDLRKIINSRPSERSDFILKELSKLYMEIVDDRANSKEIYAQILKSKADMTKYIAEFERGGKISAVAFAEDKKRATSVQLAAKNLADRLLNIGEQIGQYFLEYNH